MEYRKKIDTTKELAAWYNDKYLEMGGCWVTPPSDCNRHLDDLGVPFDQSKWLLDVGCGGGHFLEQAAKRVRCIGWDISEVALENSRELLAGTVYLAKKSIEGYVRGHPLSDDGADYITSIGSLEHVIDLPQALANIRTLLKPTGKWYFYVPNEKWKHFDQPNERTMTDEEWVKTFMAGGLVMEDHKRWNDSTAFWGVKR